jgi:transposase InsO family protein
MTFRVLKVIDVSSRECVALGVPGSSGAMSSRRSLGRAGASHDHPVRSRDGVHVDGDGRLRALATHPVEFRRGGTPGDNARNEAFIGSVGREGLSHHHFLSVEDAKQLLDAWREGRQQR